MAARPTARDDVADRSAEHYLDKHEVDAEHVLVSGRTNTKNWIYHLPASPDRDDGETWCQNQPSKTVARDPEEVEGWRVCVLCIKGDDPTGGGDQSIVTAVQNTDPEDAGLSPLGERRGQSGGGA